MVVLLLWWRFWVSFVVFSIVGFRSWVFRLVDAGFELRVACAGFGPGLCGFGFVRGWGSGSVCGCSVFLGIGIVTGKQIGRAHVLNSSH